MNAENTAAGPALAQKTVTAPTMPVSVPLTDEGMKQLKAAGVHYPDTVNAWRWLYRKRHERGMDAAFVHHGRRICIDVPKFLELSRKAS